MLLLFFVFFLLRLFVVCIMFKIINLLNLSKRVIVFFVMLPYCCRRKSGVTIPIDILLCPVNINMLTVLNVKPAVIMLGIVSTIFPALPLCLVSFILPSFLSQA